MVLTGIIPGQALGADLAELSINKVLTLTWDGKNEQAAAPEHILYVFVCFLCELEAVW